jgi:uncharacterized protein YndB with AHSA1/START domain
MHGPDGESHSFSGTYDEVTSPSRIEWTGQFAQGPVKQMKTVVQFAAEGKKTKLTVDQTFSPVTPETKPFIDGSNPGWNMTLDQLEAEVGSSTSAPDREIVITRLIHAPRERVWEAWADVDQVVQWWGPNGFTNRTKERVFKTGGHWEHTMVAADGTEYPNYARYLEVVKPERIVLTNGGGREDGPGVSFRSIITFEEKGKETLLTMRMIFPSAAMRQRVVDEFHAIEGGMQTTGRLDQFLNPFVITREFDAPLERVWKAWTDGAELKKWFGPKGAVMHTSKMDFREGGSYLYGMNFNGQDMWGKWNFRKIVKPTELTLIQHFSNEKGEVTRHPMAPAWPATTMSTSTFEAVGPKKTRITIRWSAYDADDAAAELFRSSFESMKGGWGGTFDRFVEYLKG